MSSRFSLGRQDDGVSSHVASLQAGGEAEGPDAGALQILYGRPDGSHVRRPKPSMSLAAYASAPHAWRDPVIAVDRHSVLGWLDFWTGRTCSRATRPGILHSLERLFQRRLHEIRTDIWSAISERAPRAPMGSR